MLIITAFTINSILNVLIIYIKNLIKNISNITFININNYIIKKNTLNIFFINIIFNIIKNLNISSNS